ncbi:MAG: DUF488 domain-containing protein [Chloroflexota bacterium]|nr:DUF488 domain-containing protein [Chloroflexota bacterium]
MTQIFTIGFTRKTAQAFFELLAKNRVTVVVDVRLRPDSQLAGFAKARDLAYFLRAINICDYVHKLEFAPTAAMLDAYRADKDWAAYTRAFTALLDERAIMAALDRAWWDANRACLLCSEHEPDQCHRRLVAEHIAAAWGNVEVVHLMK